MNEDTKTNEAMNQLSKDGLTRSLIISTILHLALIALFSISFISLCVKYNTLNPKAAIAAEKEQEEQKALEAKREKQAKDAEAEDKKTTSSDKNSSESKPKVTEEDKKVPEVIKNTEEVIKEIPAGPSNLNKFDDNL